MKTLIRTAAAVAALATAAACTSSSAEDPPLKAFKQGEVRLVAYSGCDDLLSGLRAKAAENVGPWGFGGIQTYGGRDLAMADASPRMAKAEAAPEHSTTNVHEAGVDEPDLVKTDGRRVFTVSNGVLKVIDTGSRKVTQELRLVEKQQQGGWYGDAKLLVSGDRALVIMQGMPAAADAKMGFAPQMETSYILVDLSGEPKVIGTVRPNGTHVDARMVGSTVRWVTRTAPEVVFPQTSAPNVTEEERRRVNQQTVRQAPVEAWLPKIEITDESGKSRTETVKCDQVSHPAQYTGTSMLTVHTVDLAQGVGAAGTSPISLAADGETVYGTGQTLYVASNPQWWWPPVQPMPVTDLAPETSTPSSTPSGAGGVAAPPDEPVTTITESAAPPPTITLEASPEPAPSLPPEETEIHRFDLTQPGAPKYTASGKVPGRLLNQYSLSEHDGHLRVATTTTTPKTSESAVYVLNAGDMRKVGEVGGLGKDERIYSVRFIGPVGYVVTFRQVDPLYTLDLRDPAAPKVTGELKITGYSAYLHPAGEGRLIGLGQEASDKGRTLGTQLSLFDVSDPANPRRLSQFFRKNAGSEAEWDPHAFLYWPKTGLTVIPLVGHEQNTRTGAMALKVEQNGVTELGMITHPKQKQQEHSYQPGIQRTLVIGDSLWTLSAAGFQVNAMDSLDKQSWIPLI
ncbi:beta-propeller domain-containing protein [Nonomuraea longicatena]|uniref:Beta-propeller domain-containing protein n=1 Tax=Nonomuraea longicatena TaxID=83682 RepID=A0ABN1PDR9_9ACTN